jgi:hypothetical protein
VGKPEGKGNNWKTYALQRMIILKLSSISRMFVGTGLICLVIGTSESFCGKGNEPSSYIKCVEFLD